MTSATSSTASPETPGTAAGADDVLWAYSAERMRAHLMAGHVTPNELVEASLARIADVNPRLNAIIDVYADEARAAAERARTSRRRHLPLRGIPVTIKDNVESKGHVMSDGSVAWKNHVCTEDAPLVRHLRERGAAIVGRTNCPPFCWQMFSSNELYGSTVNARNARRTPGGSSGGAAVSVASGMVPIAQGNDVAGSIRYPAYANAIVGLKPTAGLIPGSSLAPGDKPFIFQLAAAQGALARTVDDAFLAFDGMRGYDPGDVAALDCDVRYDANPKTVGIYLGEEIAAPEPRVLDAVTHAAEGLEERGWRVEYIATTAFERLFRLQILLLFGWFLHFGAEEIAAGGEILQRGLTGARQALDDCYGTGYDLRLDDYVAGLAERGTAIRDLRVLQERYPIILTPVSSEIPFLQDEDQTASAARAKAMAYAVWPMDAVPLAGLPAITLPTDVKADGINLGVQLVARSYDEATLHRAAGDLERHFALDHGPADVAA